MNFYQLAGYLESTFKEYPEKGAKKATTLIRRMKELYPETKEVDSRMNISLFSLAISLVIGDGINLDNYFEDGTRKKYRQVITSREDEPLIFDVVYED